MAKFFIAQTMEPSCDLLLPEAASLTKKYRLERLLGRGGMGAIYLARHLGLDRHFALKLMMCAYGNRDLFLQRFRIEAMGNSDIPPLSK